MNYEEFRSELIEKISTGLGAPVIFESHPVNKSNETLDGISIRFPGEMVAPVIYPEKLYGAYISGTSVNEIAGGIVRSVGADRPVVPEITPENAKSCISFSLVNKERNADLLKSCPYKELHDLAAVPRWHISPEASFIVNNDVMQQLRMTKEEVLSIAAHNTEIGDYSCRSLNSVLTEMMSVDRSDILPEMPETPFYVLTNRDGIDGSSAILSNKCLQEVSEKIGCDSFYILPSSRHEVLIVNPNAVESSADLKEMVMDVNSTEVSAEDFLSNEIFKYDAPTHALSMCDSKGLFHEESTLSVAKEIKGLGRG